METKWYTRDGAEYAGPVLESNPAKGIAKHQYRAKCSRCGGAGGSEKWRFTGWTCYDCGGSGNGGIKVRKLYTAEKLAKLNASQAKRDAKALEKRLAEQAEHEAKKAEQRRQFEEANSQFVALFREWHTANLDATGFLADVYLKWQEFGSLSEKQIAAVTSAIERENARRLAREASQHVGEVGKRVDITVTCEKVIFFNNEDSFNRGYRFVAPSIYLARDEHGNRIVYKGSGDFPSEGYKARVRATVKEHGERNGEMQTIIARPKMVNDQTAVN